MKAMNTLGEVIEEAKVRTVLWAICVFLISYFLSHTSKSMLINVPISVLILAAIRYFSYELEIHWKLRPVRRHTYLSHLEKKQLSFDDPHISFARATPKWRRKIDSPLVEIAIDGFVNKILKDFVIDLWYSSITPDKEAPELIKSLILDALGEVSGRLKEINLVELLTRDMVDLIGNQLDLYRRSQSEIGINVMGTLSFEERDERLKHHLLASKELHPALVSLECEHKVLQQMVGGILAVVLPPHEAHCQLVLSISRELLTCLVVQPVMSFASPVYVNELIEYAFLTTNENASTNVLSCRPSEPTNAAQQGEAPETNTHSDGKVNSKATSSTLSADLVPSKAEVVASVLECAQQSQEAPTLPIQTRAAEWALVLEAATKRRTQILAPENLENMWTKGRNYKKKTAKLILAEAASASSKIDSENMKTYIHAKDTGKELSSNINKSYGGINRKQTTKGLYSSNDGPEEMTTSTVEGTPLKRSNSTPDMNSSFSFKSGENIIYKDYCSSNFSNHKDDPVAESIWHGEGSSYVPKLQCRVTGAYFEKSGTKSFAVYSIAVTDVGNKTWFVKRRYRNFERLHRHLKDIPNYSLSLPPKRFLSSSIDDYFVHKRCILLDKFLQDLLSIANIAEQHEVWDFFSESSKNYSFGKATSVMKTLAVNVDDAMDDIVRQFKRKVVGSSPAHVNSSTQIENSMALPWNEEEPKKLITNTKVETSQSISDEDAPYEDHSFALDDRWYSDSEVKGLPPRVRNRNKESRCLTTQKTQPLESFNRVGADNRLASDNSITSDPIEDLARVPPEWTPPNVSVPLLNLVDNIFQLNQRGWLSRQVFWISKQILQLMMEDAIDDWILRQIHWLRKDEVIAQGIQWVQDILWPNGSFFLKFGSTVEKAGGSEFNPKSAQSRSQRYDDKCRGHSSFESHLEAARRASDVKKMIIGGAPTALVSLIGPRQYRHCAKDVYYFLQSSIFLKQLAYNMLELVIISVFPELRDLILDIHQKSQTKRVAPERV